MLQASLACACVPATSCSHFPTFLRPRCTNTRLLREKISCFKLLWYVYMCFCLLACSIMNIGGRVTQGAITWAEYLLTHTLARSVTRPHNSLLNHSLARLLTQSLARSLTLTHSLAGLLSMPLHLALYLAQFLPWLLSQAELQITFVLICRTCPFACVSCKRVIKQFGQPRCLYWH